ncbi:Leucine-rich repeat protein [Handroanthus impetiginosus]|uniref:Leucine-rich repeat protein n=1 Tax=Handroanthus impetiginosus TaxID=429701 RepID=A0A2G9HIE8_9LAMI|nr:Leucine-rich repeat protein [Handroanthus impetiginosus]
MIFSGSIPPEIGKLYNLQGLYPSRNNLSGLITPEIGKLYKLDELDLSVNKLSGPIPSTIGNLTRLRYLQLNSNNLTRQIPSSICNLSSLEVLHLSENILQGRIPQCLGNFSTSLSVLALKENQLHGPISATFANGNKLEYLNLNGNKLQGPLPKSLHKCRCLQDLFPFWIETLPELQVLVMKSNKFHGNMLSDHLRNDNILPFPKLQIFDISHNKFTGPLPYGYFKNFVAMMNVKVNRTEGRNRFADPVILVLKGSEQNLVGTLITFTLIDFSDNQFYGSIPYSIGKVNLLTYMNLSYNMFERTIPTSFGNLSEIPWQLTRLSFLSSLNLSNNLLSGPIPQFGGQFPMFENNSYMGNPGLCGRPLTKNCKYDDDGKAAPPSLSKEGCGCGFVFGDIMGYLALLYGRSTWLLNIFFGVRWKINGNYRRRVK